MTPVFIHIARFVGLVLLQVLIVSHFEYRGVMFPMVYPLFILLLPFEMGVVWLLLCAFGIGISVDYFSNTFGLHASASVLLAYVRPELFKVFAPRDGYESLSEGNINVMGYKWFIYVGGTLLLIHHLWFFLLEYFKFSDILYVIQQSIISAVVSMILIILLQILFFRKGRDKA